MLRYLQRRWRHYYLKKHAIPDDAWEKAFAQSALLTELSPNQRATLRELSTHFMAKKHFSGANGLILSYDMQLIVAVHACLLILELDFSWFKGWVEIIVYPDAFRVTHQQPDMAGIVRQENRVLSGESWDRGPLILSWADVESDVFHGRPGSQVVLHEFAHKLDTLNSSSNGMPPLHRNMDRENWTAAFSNAFENLRHHIDSGKAVPVNTYGASSPAEFFAVITEYFFTEPTIINRHYPDVFQQLALFYRQNPLDRCQTGH